VKPLRRLLIANRGEIVVRIAQTARRMGLATVAVYSDADHGAPHTLACDEAVRIGGVAATESYLRIDRILDAARQARADAIHPGYGFLSESADFATAVCDAGLVFVGPPAAAIAAMGDKARARKRMAAAGIAVVPGYDDDDQQESTFLAAASRLGYPVMVKAAAGGGGRGMRLVPSPAELPAALRSAASEATNAFGDGRLILERAIVAPRHVEIQLLADQHGHVIHLGERDCSVQRRHQKVIEETPSPAVDDAMRARMGEAASAVAREIGYVGAGTVEFLLDRDGRFYFMEMNTRLQVEHPVTECVTGLDLVELQLRLARGEPLALQQGDVQWRGHAIEVRLCAESPADDFLPHSGPVLDWRPPPHVRCDHALAAGGSVPPWYDSMVAKVIAHAPTRNECIEVLADALDRTVLLGVPSNRVFAARVLRHPQFRDAQQVSTGFIDLYFAAPTSRAAVPDAVTWALAAWLSIAAAPEIEATPIAWRHWSTGRPLPQPWRLCWLAPDKLAVNGSRERRGRVSVLGRDWVVDAGERNHRIDASPAPAGIDARVAIDGTIVDYRYAWDDSTLWIHTRDGDHAFECRRRQPARAAATQGFGGNELRASINGRVLEVAVSAGATVQVGDRVVVLEAMKMEHEVRATRAGRIAEVAVRPGAQVVPGQVLVQLEGEA
jgi:geranyl-CoA carboxylase alpha subunit